MKKVTGRIRGFLLLLGIFLFQVDVYTTEAAEMAEGDPIKVGYYLYSDFQEVSEQGGFSGYAYDYYSELAQYTGWKYDFQILSFEECVSKLADGSIDLVCGVEKASARQEMFEFSAYSVGTMRAELYTLKENTEIYYNDYDAMDGMTVALLRGNLQENKLDEYCRAHKITINKLYCSTQRDAEEALNVGAVDAMYLTHTSSQTRYKTIAAMEEADIYFATTKGSSLISEVNDVLALHNMIYPNFQNELYQKYQNQNEGDVPNFTKEELEYIEEAPAIRVVLDPDWCPIEYWDSENTYQGITAEIFDRISEISGLQFEYVETETFTDSIERVQKGDVSLLTAITHDYTWADSNNVWMTSPYMEMQIVVVAKTAEETKEFHTIAMPRDHYLTGQIEKDMPEAEIIYYESVEECLAAVNNEEADATYVNSYMANYYLSLMEYSHLYPIALTAYNSELSIAVSKYADSMLLTILNKSLLCITDAEIDAAIVHNSFVDAEEVSISTIIMMYPFQSILFVVLVVGAIVVLFVGIILKINSKNRKMSRNVQVIRGESEELKSKLLTSLAGTYDAVYEIDIETDTYNTLFVSEQEIGHQMVPYYYTAAIKDYANRYIHHEEQDKFIQALSVSSLLSLLARGRKNIYMEADIRSADTLQYHRYSFLLERMNKNSSKILGFLKNIDEETREKEKLILQSQKDPLTGLLNKEAFYEACDEYLKTKQVYHSAVAFLDLDNFKLLNDTFGHLKGDEAIKQSANKLQTLFSSKDILARFGGDEFCVMIREIPDEKLFDKLEFALKQLEDTYTDGKNTVTITASIGVVQIRDDDREIASLLDKADRALYKAKNSKKNRYVLYTEGMHTDSYIGRNFEG